MNSAADVDVLIEQLKKSGMVVSDMVVRTAEACLGWPYVYAEAGALDTPKKRKSRAYALDNSADASIRAEAGEIRRTCQALSGKRADCAGCKWYPDGQQVRCFDCRGFTRWVLAQAGITINGGGCTSQWNTAANWKAKGPISGMPDTVCVVFWQDKKNKSKMAHTGLHIGGGQIIHCSGEVKRDTTATAGWTHYAIPIGMEENVPVPTWRTTIRKGSRGEDVTYCQEALTRLGYEPGKADGIFGANTRSAVIAFQKDHQLNGDGVVGPLTWDAIEKAIGEGKTADPAQGADAGLYTVIFEHVDLTQAKALCNAYPTARMIEE